MSELADVRLDPEAGTPLFDQLRTQIIDGIRAGRLVAGSRLPTVRDLAGRLGLAVNTVARTYRELETAGMIETHGRAGTFVCGVDPAAEAMVAAARSYVDTARSLGVGATEAVRYVEAAWVR
ncbi:MAG TPA: GntR family transcriptional regulator [Mycobacterium sp.]